MFLGLQGVTRVAITNPNAEETKRTQNQVVQKVFVFASARDVTRPVITPLLRHLRHAI